jgi:hypothetical protein
MNSVPATKNVLKTRSKPGRTRVRLTCFNTFCVSAGDFNHRRAGAGLYGITGLNMDDTYLPGSCGGPFKNRKRTVRVPSHASVAFPSFPEGPCARLGAWEGGAPRPTDAPLPKPFPPPPRRVPIIIRPPRLSQSTRVQSISVQSGMGRHTPEIRSSRGRRCRRA